MRVQKSFLFITLIIVLISTVSCKKKDKKNSGTKAPVLLSKEKKRKSHKHNHKAKDYSLEIPADLQITSGHKKIKVSEIFDGIDHHGQYRLQEYRIVSLLDHNLKGKRAQASFYVTNKLSYRTKILNVYDIDHKVHSLVIPDQLLFNYINWAPLTILNSSDGFYNHKIEFNTDFDGKKDVSDSSCTYSEGKFNKIIVKDNIFGRSRVFDNSIYKIGSDKIEFRAHIRFEKADRNQFLEAIISFVYKLERQELVSDFDLDVAKRARAFASNTMNFVIADSDNFALYMAHHPNGNFLLSVYKEVYDYAYNALNYSTIDAIIFVEKILFLKDPRKKLDKFKKLYDYAYNDLNYSLAKSVKYAFRKL